MQSVSTANHLPTIDPLCLPLVTEDGDNDNKGLLSLRVCQDCQSSLLGAFNHCLSQHSPNISSIHEIDPVQDGLLTSEQPYFDIIKDPTIPIVRNVADHVTKDRFLFAQQKINKEQTGILSNQIAKEKTGILSVQNATTSKGFSGALYKRMLDHKDRQIQELQSRIYEQGMAGGAQEKNVDALKKALNKAVKYYTFAEEWQKKEAERLEKDVLFLKAELSSMMAFLINAEEEKRKLKHEIDQVNKIVKGRDTTIMDMARTEEQLRIELHDAFKELITNNETMKMLEKEADRGNDAAEQRNELLQKNLDKLAGDFASESQKLSVAAIRIRELEFEIEETILQFNQVGESKKKGDELNIVLSDDLAATTHELNNTKDSLEQTIIDKNQLEDKFKSSLAASEAQKVKLDNQIEILRSELDKSNTFGSNLSSANRNLSTEISSLKDFLKVMTKTKENLDASLKAANEKSKKDIQIRDSKIKEHEAARAEDAKKIRVITESREKMRAEVIELQNSLDREVSNYNVVSFEYSQFKRQTEERFLALEDQIEKLTSTKSNLSGEKKQLSERLKSVRTDLADKEQELEYTKNAYKALGEEAIANDIKLRSQIASLESSLGQLQSKHRDLNNSNDELITKYQNLSEELLKNKDLLAEFEEKDRVNTRNFSELDVKHTLMIQAHNQAVQERIAMKIHLDSVLSKFEELNNTIRNMERESAATNKTKDGKITKLSNELQKTKDENDRMRSISLELKALSEKLDSDLLKTRKRLQQEGSNKDRLEYDLQKMTDKFNEERKIRHEFERMNSRISRYDELRSLERIAALRMRDFKLKEIDTELSEQLNHLNSITELLPKGLNFGETDANPIPIFNVKSNQRRCSKLVK